VSLAEAGFANKTFTIVVADRLFLFRIRREFLSLIIRRFPFFVVVIGYCRWHHVAGGKRAERPSLVLLSDRRNIH